MPPAELKRGMDLIPVTRAHAGNFMKYGKQKMQRAPLWADVAQTKTNQCTNLCDIACLQQIASRRSRTPATSTSFWTSRVA